MNGLILLKWDGFISFFYKSLFFMFFLYLYLVNVYIICESRPSTLFDIWFWCPWYNFSNYATLKLHISLFFAAFHICFHTLIFKYIANTSTSYQSIFVHFTGMIYPSNPGTVFFNPHIFLSLRQVSQPCYIICVSCQNFLSTFLVILILIPLPYYFSFFNNDFKDMFSLNYFNKNDTKTM